MLKASSLREMTREELHQKLIDLNEEIFNLNMRSSLKQLDNPLRLRYVRKDIAKVKTVLNEDAMNIRKLADEKTSILDSSSKASKEIK